MQEKKKVITGKMYDLKLLKNLTDSTVVDIYIVRIVATQTAGGASASIYLRS